MSEGNDLKLFENGLYPFPPAKKANLLPPIVLAYIGDALYEVAVRQYLISKPNLRPHHLHTSATKMVSAKAQSRIVAYLEAVLTEEERDVVRQGRNAKSGSVPKNADVLEYRHATAFESLIGYLYYTEQIERMNELILLSIQYIEQ